MATNSAMDIAEADHSYLPEEILMRIMAFLPFSSLFRSRSVAKAWNAVVLLPHFQKLRATLFKEFIISVMNCTKFRSCRLKRSAGKMMIMARGPLDIYVVQPSIFSVRLLPHLDCALRIRNLDVFVVGLVVDDTTEDFTIFAISEFSSALRAPRNIIRAVGGAPEPEVRRNLHYFNSATNVWSLCGSGELDLNAATMWGSYRDKKQVVGVVLHRGQYVALVRSTRGCVMPYHNDTYETFIYNECRWERMRGVFPVYIQGVVLFDHRGTLYFAAPSYSGCALWSYGHETAKWVLVRNFRFPLVPDIECGPGKWKSVNVPYAQAFGDFLHFGAFDPPNSPRFVHMWEPRCRLLAYNLVSGRLEDIAHSQGDVKMITKTSGQKLLLQL